MRSSVAVYMHLLLVMDRPSDDGDLLAETLYAYLHYQNKGWVSYYLDICTKQLPVIIIKAYSAVFLLLTVWQQNQKKAYLC